MFEIKKFAGTVAEAKKIVKHAQAITLHCEVELRGSWKQAYRTKPHEYSFEAGDCRITTAALPKKGKQIFVDEPIKGEGHDTCFLEPATRDSAWLTVIIKVDDDDLKDY